MQPGDLVIIISYTSVTNTEAKALVPHVVHVDQLNRQVLETGSDLAEPAPGSGTLRGDLVRTQ